MPIEIIHNPLRSLSAGFLVDDMADTQLAAPLMKIGNTWRVKNVSDIFATAANGALANGAAMVIYTVTAGKLPLLRLFKVSSSGAGLISMRYNGVNIATNQHGVGIPQDLVVPEGLVFPTTGGVFDIVNSTGAVISVGATVVLSEYTP